MNWPEAFGGEGRKKTEGLPFLWGTTLAQEEFKIS